MTTTLNPTSLAQFSIRRLRNISPTVLYYKYQYRPLILDSPRFECFGEAEFEIHMIVCAKDVLDAIWTVKSFFFYSGLRPCVYIHEDGSFTEKHRSLFAEHFGGIKIITAAESDTRMKKFLTRYPVTYSYRQKPSFYCARKLLDVLNYGSAQQLLILDSDVLFFQKPTELLSCVQKQKSCFNSDYKSAYALSARSFFESIEKPILESVNAGLVLIDRKFHISQLPVIESYFSFVSGLPQPRDINRHEQSIYALLLSLADAQRLSAMYQISSAQITSQTISHHFVNDGSRAFFYSRGLRQLRKKEFLSELASQKLSRLSQ